MRLQVIGVMGELLYDLELRKVIGCKRSLITKGDMTITIINEDTPLSYTYQSDVNIVQKSDHQRQDNHYLFVRDANPQNLESFLEQVLRLRPDLRSTPKVPALVGKGAARTENQDLTQKR